MELDEKEIYEQYIEEIYRFLVYFTGSHDDAEDLVQETFIQAFRKWQQLQFQSSIKTWLLSIARHLAIDYYRKQKRRQMLYELIQKYPYDSPVPEEIANESERNQQLYKVIQTLKPNYRAVVTLRGLQEYSAEEVAKILNWTPNRVNMVFHRSIKQLRTKLSDDWR